MRGTELDGRKDKLSCPWFIQQEIEIYTKLGPVRAESKGYRATVTVAVIGNNPVTESGLC